jgi:uncharacterized protein
MTDVFDNLQSPDAPVAFNLSVGREDYRQPPRRSTEQGELFYLSMPAADAVRGKHFFGEVLGWQFAEPGPAGGMHVENKLPDCGLGGGSSGRHPELFFRVADLDESMQKVVALGGGAELAGVGDEGRHAVCTDDQGTPFGLSQPADGY